MKKARIFIRNVYRVFIVKPGREGRRVSLLQDSQYPAENAGYDSLFRKVIRDDVLNIKVNPEIQETLRQRVAGKQTASEAARNSLVDIFAPWVTLKNIELKMAFITLALVFTLGIGPTVKHPVSRNVSPFFLADTLIDTSDLHIPLHDSIRP